MLLQTESSTVTVARAPKSHYKSAVKSAKHNIYISIKQGFATKVITAFLLVKIIIRFTVWM